MIDLKGGFEKLLWGSRLAVILAVVTTILCGLALFCIMAVESVRVLLGIIPYFDPTAAPEAKEAIVRVMISHMISLIDGYLLGAFMLIFGFGLYELFVADIEQAKSTRAVGRVLAVTSLDDLKTRLAKVILVILIVELFKDALSIKALKPLDLLAFAGAIALIGLALFLTHGSEAEKKATLHEPTGDTSRSE